MKNKSEASLLATISVLASLAMPLCKPLETVCTAQAISGSVGSAGLASPTSSVRDRVMTSLRPITDRIDCIEIYGIPVNAERRFSYAVQKNRWHLFIRFSSRGQSGWSEMNIGSGAAELPFQKRTSRLQWFRQLLGLTPVEAIEYLHAGQDTKGHGELEAAEMAVLDLGGRLLGMPAAQILTLTQTAPVPGLFCILSDDPEKVRSEARRSLDQNLRTHLKVKLYGKTETDCVVVKAAREVMGAKAYIGGDVNMGYRHRPSDTPVDDIVAAMIALQAAGLDACEDPANMSKSQWSEVQRRVGDLSLIPDEPMRPAWQSKIDLDPAMGRIYNMHPACMGSLIETVELGRAIQHADKKLMIGDSSLVGPACPAWQQMAIGLGADWVEALEKPQENDVFQRCVLRNPVGRSPDGRFEVKEWLPGFGVEMDLKKLKKLSSDVLTYRWNPTSPQKDSIPKP